MPVQNKVSLHGSKNTVYFTWLTFEMSRFCFMTLITRHILRKLAIIRAWNGLFCFKDLKTRYISRILYIIFLCKAYFALKLEERDFKSSALETRYLSDYLHLIWAVPLHDFNIYFDFKIDAYLAIYHACRICLRKAALVAVSHSRLIWAVSLFALKNEALPTYTAFNCVLSKKARCIFRCPHLKWVV